MASNKDQVNVDKETWYSPLPESLTGSITHPAANITSLGQTTSFAEQWTMDIVEKQDAQQVYVDKVQSKFIQIDRLDAKLVVGNDTRIKVQNLARQKRFHAKHETRFSRKQQKAMGMLSLPKKDLKFEVFVPLHTLWMGYICQVIGIQNPLNKATLSQQEEKPDMATDLTLEQSETVLAKLIKADFHGAFLTVVKSKCPSNIGISGIVIKDTENMFHLISRKNTLKAIPKQGNVFTFGVGNSLITLYGNQFRTRPADRASKKFKAKPSVAL
ncbi:hypothetical protein BDV3_006672 [Batrachochytrium dendrobatidis]